MIAEGRVAIDGVALDTPATVLDSLAGVTVDGKPVAAPEPTRLFAFHKPPGCLTTEYDPEGRPTIYDRLPRDLPRVIPVGRLDMNTEGLLLLTTDGELKRQLELPATGVERSYRARAYGEVTQEALEALMLGTEIEGMRYGPINANLERRTGANAWIEMTLTEGKNREVRRVLEHLGLEVSRLIRTRYGPFLLDDLPVGAVSEIRQHDLVAFRKSLTLPADQRNALRSDPGVPVARPRAAPAPIVEPEGNLRKNPRVGARPPAPQRAERAPTPVTPAARTKRDDGPKKPVGFGARQRARFKPREETSAAPAGEPFQREGRPGPVARAGARARPKGEALETRRPAPARQTPGRQQSGEHPDYDPRTARGETRAPWERAGDDAREARRDGMRGAGRPTRVKQGTRPDRAARPDRAQRGATQRDDTGGTPRPDRPVRGKGWARPKPGGAKRGAPPKRGPRK